MIITGNKKAPRNLGGYGGFEVVNNMRKLTMSSLALSFNEVNFTPVQQDGQIWLTAAELAKALGYAKSDAVAQVYERNKDEFTTSMTTTLKLSVVRKTGNVEMVHRIFSLRGAHLIAMFSKTDIAKQFRKWVLDILDREAGNPVTKTTKKERVPLKDAVNMLVGKAKFLNYSDAYKLIHHRFNVEHIEDIPQEKIPVAVEYVHHLMGEYIPKAERMEDSELKALKLLEADTTNKVMNYFHALHDEIKRLGGVSPEYPNFDKEAIVSAVVTRLVGSSRMLLTVGMSGKPNISFVPNNSWILSDENLVGIIADPCGVKKIYCLM